MNNKFLISKPKSDSILDPISDLITDLIPLFWMTRSVITYYYVLAVIYKIKLNELI